MLEAIPKNAYFCQPTKEALLFHRLLYLNCWTIPKMNISEINVKVTDEELMNQKNVIILIFTLEGSVPSPSLRWEEYRKGVAH
jgi:hypothetical protein